MTRMQRAAVANENAADFRDPAPRTRADRDERLRKQQRDEKRIDRSEKYAARREGEVIYPLGGSVRAVA